MRRRIAGAIIGMLLVTAPALAIDVTRARVNKGKVEVKIKNAEVKWEGQPVGTTNNNGKLTFDTTDLPSHCVGEIDDSVNTVEAVIKDCGPESGFTQRFGSTDTDTSSSNDVTQGCLPGTDGGYVGQVFLTAATFCPRNSLHAEYRNSMKSTAFVQRVTFITLPLLSSTYGRSMKVRKFGC